MYLYCALLTAWMMRGFEHFADATRAGSSPRNRLALQSLAAAIASLTASSLAGGAAGAGGAGGRATGCGGCAVGCAIWLLNKSSMQRPGDNAPNCAVMARSMRPSGSIAANASLGLTFSRSTPHGESVPKLK